MIKPKAKPNNVAAKKKTNLVEWQKYKKSDCKYSTAQAYKHVNKKCNKCHKKEFVFFSNKNFITLNKEKSPQRSAVSSLDSKKNIGYIIQAIADKNFQTSII